MREPSGDPLISRVALPSPGVLDWLEGDVRAAFEEELVLMSVPGGRALFMKDDPASGLYLVLTGCLGLIIGEVTLVEPAVLIRAGEVVGEYALLLNRTQPASCIAIRDSSLAFLPRDAFDRLVMRYPSSLLPFATQVVQVFSRVLSYHHKVFTAPKTLGLIPLHPNAPVEPLASALVAAVEKSGRKAVLLDARMVAARPDIGQVIENDHDLVIYCGDTADPDWTEGCIRQSDRVLLAANAAEAPTDHMDYLTLTKRLPWREADLLLIQTDDARAPTPASPWLDRFPVSAHFHLRFGRAADMTRLARAIMGTAVGVVLAGGGARGFAHIGAIKAMRAARIPIDLVGGTSMGSIVAAGVALEWDDQELRERMHAAFVRSDPLADFTFPMVALAKGRMVERRLLQHFGEACAEDLWRPYFAVASNLTSGDSVVLRRGPIRDAVRASIAIPGILPPVVSNGNLLVDGGVMNNLPCDVMDAMRRGPVIGIDVARRQQPEKPHHRGIIRRSFAPPNYDGPGIVNLLLRSATVGSAMQTRSTRDHADFILDPPLDDVEIADWHSFDRAIERGYQCAMTRMDDLLAFVPDRE